MKKLSIVGCVLVLCLFMMSLAPLVSAQSWYDDRFDKKYVLTLINSYTDDLVNYPVWVSLNVTGSNNSELRVIYNNITSLSWMNASPYGEGDTIIGFRANISALSNTSLYEIYFSPNETISSTATNMTDIKGAKRFGYPLPRFAWDFDNVSYDASYGAQTLSFTNYTAGAMKLDNESCFAGRCWDLTNTSPYYRTTSNPYLFDSELSNMTFSIWIRPHYGAGNISGIAWNNDNAVGGVTQLKISKSEIYFMTYPGSGDYQGITLMRGLNDTFENLWTHVLISRIGSGTNTKNYSVYINGEYWGSNVYTGNLGFKQIGLDMWYIGTQHTWNNAYAAIYDEFFFDNTSYTPAMIRHIANYYDIASEAQYETPLSLPPTLPLISPIPNLIEQNTSVSVNWTASNITGASVEYNLTLYDNQTYVELWSIWTPNLTFSYNATEPLDDYIFGIYSKDNELQESNMSWSNSFRICAENFSCSHFHSCDANNATRCLEVTDYGCGHAFTGNLTDFDEDCVYVFDSHTTLMNFNLDQLNSVFIMFVVAFLWLGVMGIAFMFLNQGFGALGFMLGVVLGLMFSQISWLITIVFIFINILIMLFFRPSD